MVGTTESIILEMITFADANCFSWTDQCLTGN